MYLNHLPELKKTALNKKVFVLRGVLPVFYTCHFCLTLHLTEPSWVRVVAEHNNMCYSRQHGVRSAHLLRFGEVFQWQKSLLCCFGVWNCQLHSS
jgi:hypothetical protein